MTRSGVDFLLPDAKYEAATIDSFETAQNSTIVSIRSFCRFECIITFIVTLLNICEFTLSIREVILKVVRIFVFSAVSQVYMDLRSPALVASPGIEARNTLSTFLHFLLCFFHYSHHTSDPQMQ